MSHSRRIILSLLALLLTACGGEVIIRDTYPTPLVDPLPYRVGVVYSPGFTDYVYQNNDSKLTFELGSKQLNLYQTVFDALFQEAVPLSSASAAATVPQPLDLVVEPVLQEYAYLAPTETATDFYAVSLRYQIRLYSGNGDLIGYWPFVAYGKNRTKLVNRNESLGDATSRALRDAAAALVSQLRGVIENEQWRRPEEVPG
ncbi:MAG: hypothetical protein AAGE01_17245 [Pseudomonadota bacterium]